MLMRVSELRAPRVAVIWIVNDTLWSIVVGFKILSENPVVDPKAGTVNTMLEGIVKGKVVTLSMYVHYKSSQGSE